MEIQFLKATEAISNKTNVFLSYNLDVFGGFRLNENLRLAVESHNLCRRELQGEELPSWIQGKYSG